MKMDSEAGSSEKIMNFVPLLLREAIIIHFGSSSCLQLFLPRIINLPWSSLAVDSGFIFSLYVDAKNSKLVEVFDGWFS